jgi:hypothetical protein
MPLKCFYSYTTSVCHVYSKKKQIIHVLQCGRRKVFASIAARAQTALYAELCYRVTQPGERHRVESSPAYLSRLSGHANNTHKEIIKSPSDDKAAQYPGQRRRIQSRKTVANLSCGYFANSAFCWMPRDDDNRKHRASAATCA